mgnify:CR=1 FL=1
MGILSWILFGLIAGLIAKAIRPGADPGGWIITILVGIVGAFVGGWRNNGRLGRCYRLQHQKFSSCHTGLYNRFMDLEHA